MYTIQSPTLQSSLVMMKCKEAYNERLYSSVKIFTLSCIENKRIIHETTQHTRIIQDFGISFLFYFLMKASII